MADTVASAASPDGNLKVVAYTIPMMGHLLPLLSLCRALAKRGHRVTFAVSKGVLQAEDLCRSAGLKYAGLDDGITAEALKTHDPLGPVFEEFLQTDQKPFESLVEEEQPDVIVTDYASGAPFEVCKEKKIPLVLNAALPGVLVKRMRLLIQVPLIGRLASWIGPYSFREAVSFIHKHVMPVAYRTLLINNSSPALDGPLQMPPNYFMSGPLDGFEKKELHPEKHADLLAFLQRAREAQKQVAYITTGSLLQLSKEQVLALYEGFAACDLWVVWSLKKEKQDLLPELPERFYVNSWIPQAELVQRPELLCVLTHCGWGGTLECMLAAKPVICYAGFGDQMENARLLNLRGCGPIVSDPPNSTAKDIQNAVEDVLKNRESYSASASKVCAELRSSPGPVGAAERIEEFVKGDPPEVLPKPYHLHGPEQGCQIM